MSPVPDFDLDADTYRRRIRVRAVSPGVVVSELEDDFHHFEVTLTHDGERVVSCENVSYRWPWSTCPDAAGPLRALAGMPFVAPLHRGRHLDRPKQNCTHQFDAACHTIATPGSGSRPARLRPRGAAPDPETGVTDVRCWVDGELRLAWTLDWNGPVSPQPPFDAAPWRAVMRWADATLPEEPAETRWSCDAVRHRDGPRHGPRRRAGRRPAAGGDVGICHTMQPDVVHVALRNVGTIRDFSHDPEQLLPN